MICILKDSFENTAYLEIGIPYFAFCGHKCSASCGLIKDYNKIIFF